MLKLVMEEKKKPLNEIIKGLMNREKPVLPLIKPSKKISQGFIDRRWNILKEHTNATDEDQEKLLDSSKPIEDYSVYENNIENFIGMASMPIGLIGPLKINGAFAEGEYYVPLATTEAALVASYNRGAMVIGASGGCTTFILNEGVSRVPGFVFNTMIDSGQFILWVSDKLDIFKGIVEDTTKHGKLVDLNTTLEGNHVYLDFEFTTGDAAGQNMVTISTNAIYNYILENCPIKPVHSYIEANFSGDKKANAQSFQNVRGKKVVAEVIIPGKVIEDLLHTTAEKMAKQWVLSAVGSIMSGSIGVQAHIANGLAALYIATGQDAACVSESSIGITRAELTNDGSLYVCLTLPNIITGTIGGGTKLPSQSAALNIMNCLGAGNSRKFSEICAAMCLAGELSIAGAISAEHFTRAHQNLARGKNGK
ncbi:MAG: hydroxymethylglutaryl-CoA reductase [Alphaproteobacteria bacterium]|nr:hydroxymethylglutaryl-CoA reductase [Alphaproteobacteria bacterium]OJV11948.1 MAG: 3-hydroxy-3-methylglutaryl-CoA reductase [Alphaproteobacteria bacterium 33-17]